MDWTTASRKRREELRRQREENRKIHFEKFKEDLDEYYYEHFSDEYYNLYQFLLSKLKQNYICTEHLYNYNEFVKFVDKYSTHKGEYVEENIREYLEVESSEDDDEDQNYDFLMKENGY